MMTEHTPVSIAQFLSKESVHPAQSLTDIDINALKSLIEENSKLLDQYISELRD